MQLNRKEWDREEKKVVEESKQEVEKVHEHADLMEAYQIVV